MIGKDKITDLILSQIQKLMVNKVDFDIKKVFKTLRFKLRSEITGPTLVCVGNEGKVFSDIIVAKSTLTKDKIVILYSGKHEEPYFKLLDTTNDSKLVKILDTFNSGKTIFENKDYKNKSLQLTFISKYIGSSLK